MGFILIEDAEERSVSLDSLDRDNLDNEKPAALLPFAGPGASTRSISVGSVKQLWLSTPFAGVI
jgi:hypothetical protein